VLHLCGCTRASEAEGSRATCSAIAKCKAHVIFRCRTYAPYFASSIFPALALSFSGGRNSAVLSSRESSQETLPRTFSPRMRTVHRQLRGKLSLAARRAETFQSSFSFEARHGGFSSSLAVSASRYGLFIFVPSFHGFSGWNESPGQSR